MAIEFLLNEAFKEKDRKELEKIRKKLLKKPIKKYREAKFLRQFILAGFKQYPSHRKKITSNREEIEKVKKQITFEMPRANYGKKPVEIREPFIPRKIIHPETNVAIKKRISFQKPLPRTPSPLLFHTEQVHEKIPMNTNIPQQPQGLPEPPKPTMPEAPLPTRQTVQIPNTPSPRDFVKLLEQPKPTEKKPQLETPSPF
ncbi:hypothetical protein K8R47_01470 [archaeon]|nr:hypothetical protein [archaeon]